MVPQTHPPAATAAAIRRSAIATLCALAVAVPLVACWQASRSRREEPASPPAEVVAARALTTAGGAAFTVPVADAKATVLVFTSTTCPIANGFGPELQRLNTDFAPQGIVLVLVQTEIDITAAAARDHADAYGFTGPVLTDPGRTLARDAGATMTPEAAVLSPRGEILYRGRIDDRFPDVGQRKSEPRHTELRDALAAILARRPVPVPRTRAVGCFIE